MRFTIVEARCCGCGRTGWGGTCWALAVGLLLVLSTCQQLGAAEQAPSGPRGTGTAFVVHPDGYLLTATDVVWPRSEVLEVREASVEVSLAGKTYRAEVLATTTGQDVALLKIDADGLPWIPLGDSDALRSGDEVRVLGFPQPATPEGGPKLTGGSVSSVTEGPQGKVIQTSTAAGPGSRGGPLLNNGGQVVGVVTLPVQPEAGADAGRCVPINEIRRLLADWGAEPAGADSPAGLSEAEVAQRIGPAVAFVEARASNWMLKAHEKEVGSISFSPDGKLLASIDIDGKEVKLWDPLSAQVLTTINPEHWADCVAFSPDGSLLAFDDARNGVVLWSVSDRAAAGRIELENLVGPFCFSPDGKMIAATSVAYLDKVTEELKLWDISGQPLRTVETVTGEMSQISRVVFSPDGSLLAALHHGGTVKVFDVASGELRQTLDTGANLDAIVFLPDSSVLAAQHKLADQPGWNTGLWDASSGDFIADLAEDAVPLGALPDQSLVTGERSQPHALATWDGAHSTMLDYWAPPGPWTCGEVAADGKTVAVGCKDGTISVHPIRRTLHALATDVDPENPDCLLAFSSDGTRAAVLIQRSQGQAELRIWKTDTRELLSQIDLAADAEALAFTRDGETVALCARHPERPQDRITFYSGETGEAVRTIEAGSYADRLVFSPCGRFFAVDRFNILQVWDLAAGTILKEFQFESKKQRARPEQFSFSADGNTIVALYESDIIEVVFWDVQSGETTGSIGEIGPLGQFAVAALSADQKSAAVVDHENGVRLWELETGKLVHSWGEEVLGKLGFPGALAFSSDGRWVLAEMSSEVFVFGTQGFGWRGRIMLADPGTDEAFSPDGRQIIHHCEADGTLQLRSLDWLSIPPPRSPE